MPCVLIEKLKFQLEDNLKCLKRKMYNLCLVFNGFKEFLERINSNIMYGTTIENYFLKDNNFV